MDRKILKNYIFNIAYQVVILAMPFIMTPYLQSVFSADTLGINTWVSSNVQWFVIAGMLGTKIYGNREIARVRDNQEQLSKTFSEIYLMQLITISCALIVYLIAVPFLADRYVTVSFIQTLTLISTALDITWFFFGVEDFAKASVRNILVKIVGSILILVLVKQEADFYLFVVINGATAVLGQLIMWIQLKQYIKPVRVKLSDSMKHLRPNLVYFVPQLATNIYTNLPVNMLGYLSEDAEVTFYSLSQQFVKMFLFFITSIGDVMLPRLSNVHGKNNKGEFQAFLGNSYKMAIYLSIPLLVGICSVIPYFVPWFMEPGYGIVASLIIWMSPIVIFISISNVYGTQFLLPTGRTREYSFSVIVGAVVNFVLNFVLMPRYGALGAVISVVIAELSVTLTQWIFVHKEVKLPISWIEIVKYIVASFVMGLVIYFIGESFPTDTSKLLGLLKNAIQVLVGISTYFITLILLKSSFQKELLSKVLSGVKNRGKN